MGRSLAVIRSRDLARLFTYFGVEASPDAVATHRDAIQRRFAAEVQEIVRLCSTMPERELFKVFREALRLAYESAVVRAAHATAA